MKLLAFFGHNTMMRGSLLFHLLGVLAICFLASTVAREAIVGGNKARLHQFPYQVSLKIHTPDSQNSHICGGGIVGNQFVITAAHCVIGSNGRFKNDPITVVAGTNDMIRTEEPAVLGFVKTIFVPTEYMSTKDYKTGDIAILKLNQSLGLWNRGDLRPLQIPIYRRSVRETYDNKTAMIAGWGWHWVYKNAWHGNRNDSYLRYVEADVIKNSECREFHSTRPVSDKQLCAKVKQPYDRSATRGTCIGDDGGPLVYDKTVIGILSVNANRCAENDRPGIYTRVSSFPSFIHHAMMSRTTKFMRSFEYKFLV